MALASRLRVAATRLPLGTPRALHAAPPPATPPSATTTWLMSRIAQVDAATTSRLEVLRAERSEMRMRLDEAIFEHKMAVLEAKRVATVNSVSVVLVGALFAGGSLALVGEYVT